MTLLFMDKRGQFYIIAAVIIALVVSGATGVTTYAVIKSEPKTIYDLSSDLKEESSRIIDYGIYTGTDVTELLEEFADEEFGPYFLKKTDNANIIFIYGDKDNLYRAKYQETYAGSISMGGTGWDTSNLLIEKAEVREGEKIDDIVNINILDNYYEFKLKDNEIFYFVMVQQEGEEIYVEENR